MCMDIKLSNPIDLLDKRDCTSDLRNQVKPAYIVDLVSYLDRQGKSNQIIHHFFSVIWTWIFACFHV